VHMPPLLKAVRPRQWMKNGLVIAAPLAAGQLFAPDVLLVTVLTFVVFSAASSGVYLINDLLDVESDRVHPEKCKRPIASGALGIRTAIAAGTILLLGAPLAALVLSPGLAIVIVTYEALQIAYCIWFKHVPVVDLVLVSSGFLLRAIAGAVAVSIVPSQWFLLVASFGSLFMVAGKRYSEKIEFEHSGGATRRSLEEYSLSYLRFVWSVAAGLTLITYSLWAFELGNFLANIIPALSIVPFSMAILRYAYTVDKGTAGAPEDVVLADKQLLILGALWLVTFSIYVASR
jgi:decaprenyl-phosphate phosphoribosyltransferase